MFCQQCGAQIEDGLAFCTSCGAKQASADAAPVNNAAQQQPVMNNQPPVNQQYAQPQQSQYAQQPQGYAQQPQYAQQPYGYAQPGAADGSPKHVGFVDAIKLFFVNYVNFNGRSTKSEYWYAYLFNFLVSLVTSWIPVLGGLISLGLMIPGIAISVRRLHDTGKSWVYLLMGLIPLAGFIILIVQFCKDSDFDNQWGPAARK